MSATSDCKALLLLSDKRILANARQFARKYETELDDMGRNFSEKGWFGLWWDAYGLFESSVPTEVRRNLEEFRKLPKDFHDVIMSVEKNDSDSFEKLIKFYEKLIEKKEEAEIGLEQSNSKTVVRMYRNFLQKISVEMDRKLSKVENVAQRRIIYDARHTIYETKKEANDAKKQCETLKKEKEDLVIRNKEAEEVIKEQKSLQLEHEKFKVALIKSNEQRKRENRQLRETLMKSNEEANRRCEALQQENQKLRETFEESSKKADERSEILIQENEKLREMLEESNRKADERMLRVLQIMKQRQN